MLLVRQMLFEIVYHLHTACIIKLHESVDNIRIYKLYKSVDVMLALNLVFFISENSAAALVIGKLFFEYLFRDTLKLYIAKTVSCHGCIVKNIFVRADSNSICFFIECSFLAKDLRQKAYTYHRHPFNLNGITAVRIFKLLAAKKITVVARHYDYSITKNRERVLFCIHNGFIEIQINNPLFKIRITKQLLPFVYSYPIDISIYNSVKRPVKGCSTDIRQFYIALVILLSTVGNSVFFIDVNINRSVIHIKAKAKTKPLSRFIGRKQIVPTTIMRNDSAVLGQKITKPPIRITKLAFKQRKDALLAYLINSKPYIYHVVIFSLPHAEINSLAVTDFFTAKIKVNKFNTVLLFKRDLAGVKYMLCSAVAAVKCIICNYLHFFRGYTTNNSTSHKRKCTQSCQKPLKYLFSHLRSPFVGYVSIIV